ncbi:MAG: ATP-binding protein, partial [Thermomicrobiales bacterium]
LTPGEVGKVVVGEGIAALAADDGAVALVSADGTALLIFEAGADAGQPEQSWRSFSIAADSPVAEAVRTGRSIWLESPEAWAARYPFIPASTPVRYASRAVVPLQVESRVIGAISFSFLRERPFSAEDREFAATLARQCALALERARLYAVEQRARAEAEAAERAVRFLAAASATLNMSLDPAKTLRLVSDVAVPGLADIAAVVVPDSSPGGYGLVATAGDLRGIGSLDGVGGGDPAALVRLLTVLDPTVTLATGIAHIVASMAGEAPVATPVGGAPPPVDVRPALGSLGVTGAMVVPVIPRETPVAALVLIATGDKAPFGQGDLKLARELALRAALAYENARLFEEQVRAKEHIHTLASERSLVLGQTADGVLSTDATGKIQFINEAAHRLHGGVEFDMDIDAYARTYDIRTALGESVLEHDYALAAALRDRVTTEQTEWRLTRTDGSEVFALVSAAPLIGEQDQTLGAVLTLHDVTNLHHLERQKDQFIISVTHDLKTPLTSIKGWSQLMRLRADRQPHQKRDMSAIAAIATQAETMERQLNQLLDALRLRSGDFLSPSWQRVDLHDIAAQTVHLHQGTNAGHALRLDSPGPHTVVGDWDPDHLRRILDNLVSNAIKYSPDGGLIEITLWRDERDAHIAVKDGGIGVPEASLARIFAQFYRAPNASARRDDGPIEGLGLGLFSAHQIAKRYGGTITVASREGEGSTFSLRLPLSFGDQPTAPAEQGDRVIPRVRGPG